MTKVTRSGPWDVCNLTISGWPYERILGSGGSTICIAPSARRVQKAYWSCLLAMTLAMTANGTVEPACPELRRLAFVGHRLLRAMGSCKIDSLESN